jgi:hypothetical protein
MSWETSLYACCRPRSADGLIRGFTSRLRDAFRQGFLKLPR